MADAADRYVAVCEPQRFHAVGPGDARHLTVWDGRLVALSGGLAVSPPLD